MITFIVNTYKRKHLLVRYLQCLLSQTSPHWVCYVEDEGEQNIIPYLKKKGITDPRIKAYVLPHSHDWGYSAGNYLAKFANTEYIIFSSEDDIYYPTLVEEVLAKQPFDVCYWNMLHRKIFPKGETFITEPRLCRIDKSAFCIRKELFLRVGGFLEHDEYADGHLFDTIRSKDKDVIYKKIDTVLFDKE